MNDQIKTLIVDDDDGIRFFLAEELTGESHSVVTASNKSNCPETREIYCGFKE